MRKQTIIILALFFTFHFGNAQDSSKNLEEVVVKTNLRTFSNKNGTIKIDVANSVLNGVSNTLDLLAKLPKIQISPNKENITVAGKGSPLIYIDNQRVEINDLNSLSVEDIKTIEIIDNPSSKYEANGRVVVLITLKLSKKEGFKIVVTENASFKKYFNNYFGVNSTIKKNRFEYKVNFNYNQLTLWESNGNDFTIHNEGITSNYLTEAVTKRPQFIFGSGVFYKINEDDYLSFNFNGNTHKDQFDINTITYNADLNAENSIETSNENKEKRQFYNAFINYNHKIKSIEGIVFTGFQYSNFDKKMESFISNNYNDTEFEISQNRDQKFSITVFSGRLDFVKTFRNQMKLELGALSSQANSNSDFFAENFNPPSTTTSRYNYKEKNNAGYSQLSGAIKKMSYSIGLRGENTVIKGKYENENELSIDKDYINFFPKLQLEIPIDSTKTITFNYAKSILRPNFSSTNQISTYINPYLVFTNNINLNPTIIDEVAVSFQHNEKSVRLSYNKKKNPVYYGISYDETQNLLTFKPTNFEKETGFNLEFTLPFHYKSWSTTNVLSATINKIEDPSAAMMTSKPYLYYYSNHSFKLPKAIELAVTGWGLTEQKEGVFERNALFTIDLAVSKTFLKHFDCTLSYNDIFKKLKYYENFTMNSITANGKYFTDVHMLSLSIKYFFGKIKNSEFQEKSIDENLNRIK
ncbi:TonB-dependent outer membrane receptorprecursor [Flavobacterium limnosediminis JC2902]|uniref:TonB-dependent outer membrane receptorprecursor n=1 Tax=Flavobacterium limnosediminis JC2902 TaxID=1341181 RepID=V6SKD3_9FLAO|nr:outer membrane beta-barrel protein [Flavobacterium limnosediminis]ESU27153.1 TonB-dependent outer membrane receptorprecursor [Flavobacterium limnosediminis JC2902]